ncbi:methyltransferase [Aliidiomarina sp. Khilg15.8]
MSLAHKQQALVELGRYLQDKDYQFVTVTPQTHQYYLQRHRGRQATSLRDVFGWCLPFGDDLLSNELKQLMQRAGVLESDGDGWRSAVRWSSLDRFLFVHTAYPTDKNDAVFFGPDTYRFIQAVEQHLQRETGGIHSAVDIGCGSGAGAVYLASSLPGAEVSGVDINPQCLNFTQANSQLAGVNNLSVCSSDLLDAVEGSFDLIIANPPYMHDPDARAYRHGGGALGAGLSLRIVEAALQRLAAGGSLLLYTGVAIVEGEDRFLSELKKQLQGSKCHWDYREVDPDVFGEELLKPDYAEVERIAAVVLTLRRVQ